MIPFSRRAKMYGYAGRILPVDLTAGTLQVEEPGGAVHRTYVAGIALGWIDGGAG
jgi:aldehyde:ferredoxin oxidoreductase